MTDEAAERQRKLQHHRSRMTLLSVVNFTLQSVILALYALTGSTSWDVVAVFALVSIGSSGVFWLAIRCGWNLLLKDPGMLAAQIGSSWAVQIGFMLVAPELTVLFLVCLLVGYNHAMIAFSGRQFIFAWLLQGAFVALVMIAARDRFGYPGTGYADMAILWLFFFLCTYRLTAIGTQFSTLRAKLSEKNQQLAESLERIERLASHDELTGVLNRRSFMRLLESERGELMRSQRRFCIALLDIDHFKHVNDRYGHVVGDQVLKEFASVLEGMVRASDVFARYGGEEFIVLLATDNADAATVAIERVRHAVASRDWSELTPGAPVTFSAGVACARPEETLEQLISRADQALYLAKEQGRNRVIAATQGDGELRVGETPAEIAPHAAPAGT